MSRPELVSLLADGREGETHHVNGEITLGRDKSCDVRVKVPSISRQHAKIHIDENGKLCYTHLSSVNPSIINGNVVRENAILKNGDLLHMGDALFQIRIPGILLFLIDYMKEF